MKRVRGYVVVERIDDKVRIRQADPWTRVAGEFLMRAIEKPTAYASVTGHPYVLTISDDFGQSFTYRVGAYDFELDVYEMEWPD